jgi:hypothetical protein
MAPDGFPITSVKTKFLSFRLALHGADEAVEVVIRKAQGGEV